MPTEIRIRWEGSAPGLNEKRLSVTAFGEPIRHLLAALKRIATGLVGDAVEDKSVGRLKDSAKQLDIEIVDLVRESSGFGGLITLTAPPGVVPFLFEDLPERAASELFKAIDSERQGIPVHSAARKYLRSLPSGIVRQTYTLSQDGVTLNEVSFGTAEIVELPKELPYLVKYSGRIAGVSFEPGKPEVRIYAGSRVEKFDASAAQVEAALGLRTTTVEVTAVVTGAVRRLLIVKDSLAKNSIPTRDVAIYEHWNDLLHRLAK